jgi:thiamine transport system ATP-binding protein
VSAAPPRLAVRGATVRYGDRVALLDLDLDVAAHEVVAVLGPSGSGKSTLLRAVAGLEPLAAGSIALDGRDLAGVAVHRRGVGLMFQEHALFPHRDVGGNVGFGLRMQGRSRADQAARVAELLDLVGLPGAERRPVAELSGGEQQRVALARALAPEPGVLLLDEPLGALDRTLRDRLVDELRRLFTDQGTTVVAVTHDQAEAFALADRVVVLDEGRLLQEGTPSSVWHAPASARVAALLGLGNVVQGRAQAGTAATAWGALAVPGAGDGPVTVLVRPDGVRIGGRGPLAATVREATFRGTTSVVELAVDGAPPLVAEVPSAGAPGRGDRVRARIEPAAVVVLPNPA